jgi:hypothetical protein
MVATGGSSNQRCAGQAPRDQAPIAMTTATGVPPDPASRVRARARDREGGRSEARGVKARDRRYLREGWVRHARYNRSAKGLAGSARSNAMTL